MGLYDKVKPRNSGIAQPTSSIYPTGENVKMTLVCLYYFIQIKGQLYRAQLFYLPLRSIDIILGMDWLMENKVIIDCARKLVILPSIDEPIVNHLSAIPIGIGLEKKSRYERKI